MTLNTWAWSRKIPPCAVHSGRMGQRPDIQQGEIRFVSEASADVLKGPWRVCNTLEELRVIKWNKIDYRGKFLPCLPHLQNAPGCAWWLHHGELCLSAHPPAAPALLSTSAITRGLAALFLSEGYCSTAETFRGLHGSDRENTIPFSGIEKLVCK